MTTASSSELVPSPVGAVNGDAGGLASGEEAGDLGRSVLVLDPDLSVDVAGDAAHRVVRGGLDRDGRFEWVDAGEVAGQVQHGGEGVADAFLADRPQVHEN